MTYKSTQKAEAFMGRTASSAIRPKRTSLEGIAAEKYNPATHDSAEAQRDALVRHLKALEARILTLPKGSAERRELGTQKLEVQNQIGELRAKCRTPGAGQYFIDAAKEILPKPQFDAVMRRAVILAGGTPWDARVSLSELKRVAEKGAGGD